jgi:hypothetical protein
MDFNSILAYFASFGHVFSADMWLTIDQYFKTILVFSHFLLSAFALISILTSDYIFLKNYNIPLTKQSMKHLEDIKNTTLWTLFGLVLTGVMIVLYGMVRDPTFMINPKLYAKFMVVLILTLNGFFVHHYSDKLNEGMIIAYIPGSLSKKLCYFGAISSTSWLWACFLGVARAWNKTMDLALISVYYFGTLVAVMAAAQLFHNMVVHYSRKAVDHANSKGK